MQKQKEAVRFTEVPEETRGNFHTYIIGGFCDEVNPYYDCYFRCIHLRRLVGRWNPFTCIYRRRRSVRNTIIYYFFFEKG